MKPSLFDFLFGEAHKKASPTSRKGLKEQGFLKPSLHSEAKDEATLTSNIAYRLVRAKRKSVGFVIDESGLTVRAPRWVSREEIETMIHEKEDWIHQKITQFADWQSQTRSAKVCFAEGEAIPYLGKSLTIRLLPMSRTVIREDDELLLNLPQDAPSDRIKTKAQVWFKNEAKRYLGARLAQMAQEAGLHFMAWQLSSAKRRWGCCTSARTIRLNWRLIHLDVDLIDYVIAHELAHLEEMNHSERFWSCVQRRCPDYESRRRRLKTIYIAQLPFE